MKTKYQKPAVKSVVVAFESVVLAGSPTINKLEPSGGEAIETGMAGGRNPRPRR